VSTKPRRKRKDPRVNKSPRAPLPTEPYALKPKTNHLLQADNAWLMEMLFGLGKIHATTKEVSSVLDISEVTLMAAFNREPTLRDEYERGKDEGKMGLRRTQLHLAETSAAMAIFLGKNLLGQRDDANHSLGINISVEVADARERLAHFIAGEAATSRKVADLITIDAEPDGCDPS
jgi:hypothetical protein